MRNITYIVIHCTGTSPGATIESIKKYWRDVKKWKSPGYHLIIDQFGKITRLAADFEITNGAMGHNQESIHIAYIGGIDRKGKAIDTRSQAQKMAMKKAVIEMKFKYPDAIIQGHRDFDGVKKDCPSFDVKKWLESEEM